jgi:hypothetical protein
LTALLMKIGGAALSRDPGRVLGRALGGASDAEPCPRQKPYLITVLAAVAADRYV